MSELVKKLQKKLPPGEFRIQVRIWTQWAFLALAAGPLFILAPIVKQIPAPWYVCWSCPTAIAACPLGTLQHYTASGGFSFFAVGFLALIGVLIGRMTCGWTCPMGFVQEMLYKAKRYGNYIVGGIIFVTTMFLAWFTPFLGLIRAPVGEGYGLGYLLSSGNINAFIGWLLTYLSVALLVSVPFFLVEKKNKWSNFFWWLLFIVPFAGLFLAFYLTGFMKSEPLTVFLVLGIVIPITLLCFMNVKKFSIPNNLATFMRWFFFIVPFIIFPYITRFVATDAGIKLLEGEVWWCKICPIGTITAGFPQMYLQLVPQGAFPLFGLTSTAFIGVSTYQGIFGEARVMYFIKWVMTSGIIFAMVNSKRFFCKAVCPLGTFFTIFNWFSATRIKVDQANCRGKSCNWCLKHCPMDIAIYDPTSQWHCIRCLDCLGCPFGVVTHEVPVVFSWMVKKEEKTVIPLKTPNPPNNPTFLHWANFINYTPPQAR